MISKKDEAWLKMVLADCLEDQHDEAEGSLCQDFRGFKILIARLVKNIKGEVCSLRESYKERPNTEELTKKLDLLEKSLFYLERFCKREKKNG